MLPDLATHAASLAEAARDFTAISPSDSRPVRRAYLRRLFTSAKEILWIVDPNLKIGVAEELSFVAEDLLAREVRLLSHDRLQPSQVDRLTAVAGALNAAGISIEWRVLAPRRQFHDRGIGDEGDWVTFSGPIGAVHDPTPSYSQNHLSRRPPNLDIWWKAGQSVL